MRMRPSQSSVMNRNVGSTYLFNILERQLVLLRNARPVVHTRAAQRIHRKLQPAVTNCIDINNVWQVIHVRRNKVILLRRLRRNRAVIRQPPHALQLRADQLIRAILNPLRRRRVRRSTRRRVVLESAVLRRIVRRRNHNAIRRPVLHLRIVFQNRVRQRWRRRISQVLVHQHVHAVRRQHLQRRRERRLRERVRILRQKQRPGRLLIRAILADRLRDRQNVRVVEACMQRRPAMSARPEAHPLRRIRHIRMPRIKRRHQPRNIHQPVR